MATISTVRSNEVVSSRSDRPVVADRRSKQRERRKNPQLRDFAELYLLYFPKVFAYVHRRVSDKETSMDIVSDTFERAFANRASLRSEKCFGGWLFAIARNEIAAHWRKSKPANSLNMDEEETLRDEGCGPEESALIGERRSRLSQLVRELPTREQQIISLKFDAELTSREIAAVLNLSHVHVRVMLFRALGKLRDRMRALQDAVPSAGSETESGRASAASSYV